MKTFTPGNSSIIFEVITRTLSGLSLLVSLASVAFLADSAPGGKAYAGAALYVFALAVLQALGFVIGIGIPGLVLTAKRRLRMTRPTLWLTAAALAGIAGQIAAVLLIPAGPDG